MAARSGGQRQENPVRISKQGEYGLAAILYLAAQPSGKLSLRDEIAGAQNRITTARGRWISAIKDYNLAVRTFPGNVFAGMFGFGIKQFYETSPGNLETPKLGEGKLL